MEAKDFGQAERGVCVGYATIKGKDMIKPNDPNYQWRPATKGDIGALAKFGDTNHKTEPIVYGILRDIETQPTDDAPEGCYAYQCEHGLGFEGDAEQGELEWFSYCWIQYDANKEP